MRYYTFALNATSEQIKEKTKINLCEYAYENTLAAVNEYMYKNLDNAVSFFAYRQEENVIVILAGYNERMHDFMKINEGLKSRIPHWVDFPDYSADELTDIFKLIIRERGFLVTDEAIKEAHYIFEKVRNTDNFGNGRYVRNLIDRASQDQAVRLLSDGKDASVIRKDELFRNTKNDICMLEEGMKKERKPGSAEKELDNMIGLASVKEIIHKQSLTTS